MSITHKVQVTHSTVKIIFTECSYFLQHWTEKYKSTVHRGINMGGGAFRFISCSDSQLLDEQIQQNSQTSSYTWNLEQETWQVLNWGLTFPSLAFTKLTIFPPEVQILHTTNFMRTFPRRLTTWFYWLWVLPDNLLTDHSSWFVSRENTQCQLFIEHSLVFLCREVRQRSRGTIS